MFSQNPKLFKDPKIDYPIYNLELNFTKYIAESKKIIANTRIDLSNHNAEKIINANAPFELKLADQQKFKCGALLIHGLFDSPFHLRDIGIHLKNQGLLVRSLLLPGHGTVPGALLNVDYQQWLQAVHYGIHSLSKEVDEIFLVGDSTGASLALYQAKQTRVKIAGIILLSPALKIRTSLAPLTNWYKIATPLSLRAAWLYIGKEDASNYVKYSSFPFNAVHQVYRLTQEIKKNQEPTQPTCPLFVCLSRDDKTVCAEAIIHHFQQHTNPLSQLLLYTNQPTIFNDSRIIVRHSAYPEMRIVNFSHICVPISPLNEYYGINGEFAFASHVNEKNNFIYGEFTKIDVKLHDLLYRSRLAKTQYQRLTFNPDFKHLTDLINQFIVATNNKKGFQVGNTAKQQG